MTSKLPILGIGVVAVLMICALGGVIIVNNNGDSGTDVATDVTYTAEAATATSSGDASTDAQVRTATSTDAVSVSDVQSSSDSMSMNYRYLSTGFGDRLNGSVATMLKAGGN